MLCHELGCDIDWLISELKSRLARLVLTTDPSVVDVPWWMVESTEAKRSALASALVTAQAELDSSLLELKPSRIKQLSTFAHPPVACALVVAAARIVLAEGATPDDLSWDSSREILKDAQGFVDSVRAVDALMIQPTCTNVCTLAHSITHVRA